MDLNLTLPWPPSVNRMWRTPHTGPLAGRTMLSREGRDYRQAVVSLVRSVRVPRHSLSGRLKVVIVAFPPDRRRRDIDNLQKAALDSIVHAGLIRDDADIDDLHISRGDVVANGCLAITIAEIAGTSSGQLFQETGT